MTLPLACPTPIRERDEIVLGHGSGGRLAADLLERVFLPELGRDLAAPLEDASTFSVRDGRLAITTDSFVVSPRFFPGGDIGRLAVCGTVNDLAVAGAKPTMLTAAFLLEEGLAIEELRRVVRSMRAACGEASIAIVAGDTKVVERGHGDGVFITTTGIGVVPEGRSISAARAVPGDAIVLSGTLGDHGVAVMCAREGFELEGDLRSDVAPLASLVERIFAVTHDVHAMRDPTRGGLASALTEIAKASSVGIELEERHVPIRDGVRAACELLGLDPLYVANEGKLVAILPAAQTDRVVASMREHPLGREARVIGRVVSSHPGVVTLRSVVGGERVVPLLAGEQLPRIC